MAYLAVLAKLDAERKRTFGAVATVSRLELAQFDKVEAVLTWLEAHEPKVVVFDAGVVQAEKLCRKVRSKKNLASVPIIAIAEEPTDALVERLYAQGADDVIPSALGASLVARLKALPDRETLTQATHGIAVVADKDHGRCDVIGRVLMNAGYDVKFALDDVALRYYTQQNKPCLVVVSAELGDTRKFVEEAQKKGLDAAWVVMASRRDLVKHAELLEGIDRLTVVASSTPPENVLFTSNELLRQGGPPSREHERVLYGTIVSYKPAGGDQHDVGFTYNISSGGLYVRTLSPPEDSLVWLELRPPRGKRRVCFEAKVVWRRPYDPASGAAVPPGFGVILTDGLGSSVELWKTQVEAFVRSTRRGPAAVARLLDQTLSDPRASQPELDRPSESHIAAIPVSLPPQALELAQAAVPAPAPAAVPVIEPLAELEPPAEPEPPAVVEPAPEPELPQAAAEAPAIPALAAPAVVPPPRRSSTLAWVALAALLLVAAATALVLLELGPFAKPKAGVAISVPATSVRTTPSPASSPIAPSPSAPLPAPSVSAAPVAVDAAAAAAADPGDGSELSWDEGYLAVRSAANVDVYATGFKLGPTNRKNKSKCGLKFVRLGEKDPPRWLTAGRTVDVKCRATTELELTPD